ncbi:MAG: tripartite tricarboxylate transporter TctB family protein [Acetanaerobacterium sp.]
MIINMLIKYIRFMTKNYLFAVLAFAFTCLYWFSAKDLPAKSLVFPKALLVVLIPLFIWNGVNSVWEFRKTLKDEDTPEAKKWNCSLHITSPKVIVTLITLGYTLLIPILGFFLCTIIYLAVLAFYLGIRKPIPLILFTVLLTAVIYGVFVLWLMVRLPSGIIF